jgi:hypothetical protein|tara:strand:+ start:332 stop:919 length:588 start_codon:yes stop_codon:yes gene_type:complete
MASSASDIARAYPQAGQALAEKIVEVSNRLEIPDPGWLANLINFESAHTFSPSVRNPTSTATGLIQFMASTATGMGTSTTALASMSAVAQMDWVEKYLRQWKSKGFSNPTDLYMAVFYPAAMGNPDYQFPAKVVAANNGISNPREYTEKANRGAQLDTGMRGVEILDTGIRVLPILLVSSMGLLALALLWRRYRR